jgi:hypothetical protein
VWITANSETSDAVITEMMGNVRLHLLTPQFIRDEVLTYAPIATNIQCRNQIDEAILRQV